MNKMYECDMSQASTVEGVHACVTVSISGNDVSVNTGTEYTHWMIILASYGPEYEDYSGVYVYPVARDLSTEYDTPYVNVGEQFSFDDAYSEWETWIAHAMGGQIEHMRLLDSE